MYTLRLLCQIQYIFTGPPDKSAYLKIEIVFLISQPKHMLWVFKRTISMRRFFWAPKTYVNIDRQENNHNFTLKKYAYLDQFLYFNDCSNFFIFSESQHILIVMNKFVYNYFSYLHIFL